MYKRQTIAIERPMFCLVNCAQRRAPSEFMVMLTAGLLYWSDVYKRQGYCDYYWTPTGGSTWSAVGWYGALLSASANSGAYAGFGSLHAYNRSSYEMCIRDRIYGMPDITSSSHAHRHGRNISLPLNVPIF